MISPKDIADMFAELEIYLIQSFKRNLKRHKDWEKDEGFEWSAWQAEKLRELNIFRRQNKTIAKNFISRILPETRQMLIEQYKEGSDTTPSFFGINERRLNALIDEMLTIEQDVTKAALRNVDDAYRQTVLKAAAARNSGTMTLYQAVDMASKEFLSKGINCVQYKDGRRVNIVSYAEMALRTNATRSRLYGQRAKMKEMGIDTVIISQYGGCSPTCLPWQGKVYIDDVFCDFEGKKGVSWGISNNGNTYMLLSHAMKNGLFHPNCRHNARIYREGITRIPRPLDKDTVNKNYALEQQQHALERDVRKAKRLEEGTLDEEKKKEYTAYRKYAQKQLREFIAEHDDVLRRDLWREKVIDTDQYLNETIPQPIQITTQSISNVKAFDCQLLDKAKQSRLMNAHKRLLMAVRKETPGTEYAAAFDLDMNQLGDYIKGSGASGTVKLPRHNAPYIVIHNHPSGELFSESDIQQFLLNDNIKMLTAVGNNGYVYAIEKVQSFEKYSAINTLRKWKNTHSERLQSFLNYESAMNNLLQELSLYGTQYHATGN